ncbi:MAG: sarcosine oxidase subunit beta family protein [Pseudomonadota bacterium]|jgi:sarcosine oxidase subunit beta|nr:sarcosine oxidase subunit beta family protein [Rubrivivax sp.]MCA3260112.1 sarcosine oxidase subunit beta family protein [Rubrivivax sp.]MCE2912381.1 sarcosine oxidase subunit beta family protein [Rubrivivax sp.]MCZ8032892.1 sarcosine oxidase subunit beta family protein [Rubrivivax sp.]
MKPRTRYSLGNLLAAARGGHADWAPAWREAEPKAAYDIVIVGGGGHGLATACYLTRNHGITNVAVLEAGWIGGGNTGRNTTIVRSNYLYPESARLYDFSLKLYEGLSRELNYNIMLSARGVLTLAHSRHDLDAQSRWANAMRCNGIDAELLDARALQALEPRLNFGTDARFPILGGFIQRRAGPARHDAVAWGYARAASALGVDIVQNCPVTGFLKQGERVVGVQTPRGPIRAEQVALAVAGHSSVLARMAGFELPVTSYALQAMVSEPVKPVLNTVTLSPALGAYWSQSDKGEVVIGGALDHFPSYAQRGSFDVMQQVLAATAEMFPTLGRLRLLRQWAGIVDVVADSSPIIGPTPVPGLSINCGWGTGGFKAIPVGGWTLAHWLATGRHHELAEPFQLARFHTGRLIDEAAAAGIAH